MKRLKTSMWLSALALHFSSPAQALEQASSPPSNSEPLWELGVVAFGLNQQAWPGADESVARSIALPYVLYRGPLLRIDREAFGLRAMKRSGFELDVGFSGALGSRSGDTLARQGMPELGTLVELGPRARMDLGNAPAGGLWRLQVPLRGVFDVNNRFAYRGLALDPEIQWNRTDPTGSSLTLGAGALFGDRQLAGVFYDVAPAYVTASRDAYDAKAGLIAWRLRLSTSHRLSPDWRVFGFGRIDSVAAAANAGSPLVSRNEGFSFGVGLQWTWRRSDRLAAD
jgi:hypothetical protein